MKNSTKESIHELISRLAKREETDPEKIIEIILNSFKEAYSESQESSSEIKISFDREKREFLACNIYQVVEKIDNDKKQILSSDKRINEDIKIVDGKVAINIDLKNLPKSVGYKIRKKTQEFISYLRIEKQYQNFLPLKGEIVSGYIQSIHDNFCIVNLGKGLGYWDKKEWNFEDKNYLGKHLRFLLVDVQEKSDLKQLILSRKSEDFIRKLFEVEVPEVKEGLITIEKIIRIPGLMSKVIVKSNKFKLDPVGTCIGKKGSRIRSIVAEMKRERIDLVAWNDDVREMIFNLMSPVEIISLIESKDGSYIVFIPEHRISLALYGSGKIIQKTEEYLAINLHIKSFEKSQEEDNVIVWNGNINFNDYEVRKDLFSSKQRQIEDNKLAEKKAY